MKKSYEIRELDCAHCAAKIEAAIGKLEGVQKASLSVLTGKLTLEVQEEKLESVLAEARRICKRIEPDCEPMF